MSLMVSSSAAGAEVCCMAPSMAILAGVDMPTTHELRWQRWISRVVKVGSEVALRKGVVSGLYRDRWLASDHSEARCW